MGELSRMGGGAKKLPREITPPERVWISLRAQLEEEGIIRTPADVIPTKTDSWWQSIDAFFRNRVLATATVGILIVAAAVFLIRSERPPGALEPRKAVQIAPPQAVQEVSGEFAGTAQALNDQKPAPTERIFASTSPVAASL